MISTDDLDKLGHSLQDINKTKKKLIGPTNQQLHCLGYIKTTFTWGDKQCDQICYVCKNLKKALLGKPAINSLQIATLLQPTRLACNDVNIQQQEHQDDSIKKYMEIYPEVFNGLGCLKGEPIKIKVKKGTTPYCIGAPRHIAIPLLDPVKDEIECMERMGVIRKIDKPTEWCHPMVAVIKPNGSIRLCIDLTKLNVGIEREYYQLEPVEETLAKLAPECKIMSKLDANSGYWQVPLDENSQLLTTFITPIGRYCSTRGPFGLSSMQEIFNKKMDQIIEGLDGIAKSTDDFLVYARDETEHDERMHQLLTRFRENGVTLNVDKCIFKKQTIEFLGHKIGPQGIQPVESKIAAITNLPTPTNITELRRFLGMANQMAKFHTDLASISEPLRDLLSVKNDWIWTPTHTIVFNQIKEVLSQPPILKLYDHLKPTKLRVDGSKLNGIGVILYQQHGQEWYPVSCASRYLTPTEKRYHNIEIEMLALTWGIEKMNMYVHGLPHFKVQTDHKPLIPIINNKPINEMSVRIQRMRIRLLKYSFTAEYVKGEDMEDADALSRQPHEQPTEQDEIAEQEITTHIATVIKSMPASDERIQDIIDSTTRDSELIELIEIISKGWPEKKNQCPPPVQKYWESRHDLTEVNGIILKGNRIVVPRVLRPEILKRLHEGHQGMEKTKRRARQSCYWPNMNSQIEQKVRQCVTCTKLLP